MGLRIWIYLKRNLSFEEKFAKTLAKQFRIQTYELLKIHCIPPLARGWSFSSTVFLHDYKTSLRIDEALW